MKDKKTKFIFVTGGVCSSLGKGLSTASLGLLLEGHGYKVSVIKMDPYINIDPGTMSPYQHGEVYVTEDGAETDLDLGYYERFTNAPLSQANSVSTGQIYFEVITRERRGDYLGRTVQVVPHITNEIKKRIYNIAQDGLMDFVLVEIGGTVGDIESFPFLESIRQIRQELGRTRALNVHLTLVPTLTVAGEHKTKPTQHSVKELMQIGIIPDILLCRATIPLSDEMRSKIALFCNVSDDHVISALDSNCIYDIPMMLHDNGYDKIVLEHFGLKPGKPDITAWKKFVDAFKNPKSTVQIGVIGKYIALPDAYKSIYEALVHAGAANNVHVDIVKIDPEDLEKHNDFSTRIGSLDGILVPGGFGNRGVEGKIDSIKYARENNIPFFGICLGLQCAVIEFGRNVCGLKNANTKECEPECENPVISPLVDQEIIIELGGTMRKGSYPCELKKGSGIRKIYGDADLIRERHRHRYEFTMKYKELYESKGLVFGGLHPNPKLVETIELPNHRWFYAVQYHPEFQSKPVKSHPLFKSFVEAAVKFRKEKA
ncbi:MAG TPA: CTP synthase [Spirochaetota bacterium]|nr:CTP synthase [Spirochaetota bacterium]HOR44472.1 CTP synthase [Spirochaetota bacterium]HPK56059.1 CTP synthase [Spirochaetota bacterium]